MSFLEGTALGELLRQIESMEGDTYDQKLFSFKAALSRQITSASTREVIQQNEKLRFFVAGLQRLEQISLLAPASSEIKTAIAA